MARNESDREDLLSQATALTRRIELSVPGEPELVVAGFHSNGGLSIYFGSDPVYQFNRTGRLRRGYVDGALYRTQGATLARLIRHRTATATELQRHDLAEQELEEFLAVMRRRVQRLLAAIAQNQTTIQRQIPTDRDIIDDLTTFCRAILTAGGPLAAPIRGKR